MSRTEIAPKRLAAAVGKRQGLSIGTIKNRMSHLRWWARRIGKPNLVRSDNASYGIGERKRVTNEDRSRDLPDDRLALVRDAHIRMALRLSATFRLQLVDRDARLRTTRAPAKEKGTSGAGTAMHCRGSSPTSRRRW